MTPDAVARYLQDHPEFFDEYAEMLATITVPHPHGGRAIPISERQMVTLREKFIAGAQAHSGVPPETGARVWELMAAFAGYGFPKAHAASYAQVAWRGAWC